MCTYDADDELAINQCVEDDMMILQTVFLAGSFCHHWDFVDLHQVNTDVQLVVAMAEGNMKSACHDLQTGACHDL